MKFRFGVRILSCFMRSMASSGSTIRGFRICLNNLGISARVALMVSLSLLVVSLCNR